MSAHPIKGQPRMWAIKQGEPQYWWERPDPRPVVLVVGPCSYPEAVATARALGASR